VWILDNASTDSTRDTIEAARQHGPLRYHRNATNGGSARNIVKGPLEFAAGEFVCVWSAHCLIYPGALKQLLRTLAENRHMDAFYVNFRIARYPEHWPRRAPGGYDGPYSRLLSSDLQSRTVERWEDLLDARSDVCTHLYAHIFKRLLWREYWEHREVGDEHLDVLSTYPHTCALAESMFGKPSFYIGGPALTAFYGAQGWTTTTENRARVYLRGYPELLELYRRLGWSGQKLREAEALGAEWAGGVILDLLRAGRSAERNLVRSYVFKYWHHTGAVRAFFRAFIESKCCLLARLLCGLRGLLVRGYRCCSAVRARVH